MVMVLRDKKGKFLEGNIPWNKQNLKVRCSYCGNLIKVTKYQLKKFKKHYCDKTCKYKDSKNNKLSMETRRKISNALKGRKKTPEHLLNIKRALKNIKREYMKYSPNTFKKGHIPWNKGRLGQNANFKQYGNKVARRIVREKWKVHYNYNIFVVHHIDGNPLNNNDNNLVLIDRKFHTHLHHQQGDIRRNL